MGEATAESKPEGVPTPPPLAPGVAGDSEAIAVYARLKPVGGSDTRGEVMVPSKFGKQKSVQMRNLEFSLDWIFTESESQEQLYNIAAHDRVASVIGGFNATILAYGQTGAGKTHTMFGPDEVLTDFIGSEPAHHGIVPRASDHLFEGLRHGAEDSSFIVQCSYLEVYNNTLNDLLGGKSNLPMREKPGTGTVVEGLTYEMVGSSREVMANLARGNAKRVVAAMKMNARSSRGHAIFTLYVKEILAYGGEKAGKLNLVDLAGMESSKRSYAVEGASNNEMRKIEAKNINTSLYALGSVIEALSRASQPGEKKGHVPYRDSKLTRLLQDSLGGNSKCTIVVALRIETQNIEESINTLRFAQRAKAVKTIVKDNTITIKDTDKLLKEIDQMSVQMETANLMVRQLQQELAQRMDDEEKRLQAAKANAAEHSGPSDPESSSAELAALREEVALLRHKNTSMLHKQILHRVLKAQSEKAISALRDANAEAVRQLSEAEEILNAKERENRALQARNEELERVIVALQNGQAVPSGITMPAVTSADGSAHEAARDDMISQAETELKAAMAAGDPERLKAAIANASATVAKARAKGAQVLKKQQVLHGDGVLTTRATEHMPTVADALTDEEKLYVKFHEVATARKLALASRGFEVQNVFIDTLYDAAVKASVPPSEWGEFVRFEIPSPRGEGGSGGGLSADEEIVGVDEVVEEVDASGGVHKVRKAVKKMAKVRGWMSKVTRIAGIELVAAAPLMERPDDMPIAEGAPAADARDNPHAGKSLHMEVASAATNVADAHLAVLQMADPDGTLTPNGSPATRAQRYNAKLRERMGERDATRKASPR